MNATQPTATRAINLGLAVDRYIVRKLFGNADPAQPLNWPIVCNFSRYNGWKNFAHVMSSVTPVELLRTFRIPRGEYRHDVGAIYEGRDGTLYSIEHLMQAP